MDTQLWVLIYSKFSPSCNDLFNFLQSSGVDLELNGICIDDKRTRERVLKDERFSFKQVPTILGINMNNGIVSQFEGEKAFQLIENMIPRPPPEPPKITMIAQEPPPPPPPTQVQQIPNLPPPPQHPPSTSIDELFGGGLETTIPITTPKQVEPKEKNTKKISVSDVMTSMAKEKESFDLQYSNNGQRPVY